MWCQYFDCIIKNGLPIAVFLKVESKDMSLGPICFYNLNQIYSDSECSREQVIPLLGTKILSPFMWCQYFNGIIKNSLFIAVFLKVGSKDMTLVPICFSNINQIHSNSECSRWQSIALLWTKIFPASMWCQYFYCDMKNTLSIPVFWKSGAQIWLVGTYFFLQCKPNIFKDSSDPHFLKSPNRVSPFL